MKKIKLKVLGLSYSQSQIGSYVLVLSEVKGDRKLPVIIKTNEAQYIALKMEDIDAGKPMIHDIFKSVVETLGGEIEYVYIENLVEGVFQTKLLINNNIETYEIECSIGDAVAISLSYECPIYASKNVLEAAGILMNDDGRISENQNKENHKPREKQQVSLESLQEMLKRAVENDEFEIAAQLRDRINQLKEN